MVFIALKIVSELALEGVPQVTLSLAEEYGEAVCFANPVGLGDAAGLSRVVALRREALRPPLLKVRRGVGAKQTKRRVRGGVCGFFGAWT